MPVSEEAREEFNIRIRSIKEQINGLINKDKTESLALKGMKEMAALYEFYAPIEYHTMWKL